MKITDLKLRELEESDLEMVRWWRMLPRVTEYLFTDPLITNIDQKEWYKGVMGRGDLFWIITYGNVDVGYTSLSNLDDTKCELGIAIGEVEYWGNGLGKKVIRMVENHAFGIPRMHKLYAHVTQGNYSGLMCFLKNGWKVEGVLRDHVFKYGRFHDVYTVALLNKGDWI